ncbi:MAG: hypothetical protein JO358_14495 [Alphaproteobacteria bacterium]|nr:hypothetical protein [Alphaproteobacteria bacterium]
MKIAAKARTFLVASLSLAGCVAPGGTTVPQTTKVNYYPQCYQPVQQLRQADQQFAQTMAINTALGAAGGAALGGLISKNWQGALYGALAGGATAAAGTYAQARFQQEADDERRAALMSNDLYHDSSEMQRAVVAARQANNCYNSAFNQVASGVRRGTMPREEARLRFAEIYDGQRETAAILAQYGKKANDSVQEYRVAVNQQTQKARSTRSTHQMTQNFNRCNQQVSDINQEQSSIQREADAQRHQADELAGA